MKQLMESPTEIRVKYTPKEVQAPSFQALKTADRLKRAGKDDERNIDRTKKNMEGHKLTSKTEVRGEEMIKVNTRENIIAREDEEREEQLSLEPKIVGKNRDRSFLSAVYSILNICNQNCTERFY